MLRFKHFNIVWLAAATTDRETSNYANLIQVDFIFLSYLQPKLFLIINVY